MHLSLHVKRNDDVLCITGETDLLI